MKSLVIPFILLLSSCIGLISCRDKLSRELEDEQLYEVAYDFSGFEKEYGNIGSNLTAGKSKNTNSKSIKADVKNLEGRRLLYFWNFDAKKLDPTYSNMTGALLYFDKPNVNYAPGFNTINNPSDYAVYEIGVKTFYVDINVKNVKKLDVLEFDIGTGDQSPKLINLKVQNSQGQAIMNYSENYLLSDKKTPFKIHTARFDISKLPIDQTEMRFLITFLPNPDDKETSVIVDRGTIMLDNIRIHGYLNNIVLPKLSKFHYYIFQKDTKKIFSKGVIDQKEDLSSFVIKLPYGEYENLFIYNQSEEDILVPNDLMYQSDFYMSNQFSNKHARIFANLDQIQVNQSFKKEVQMKRLYSLIKFSFTDLSDLSEVKKIVIHPLHDPLIWTPFSGNSQQQKLSFNVKPIEIVKNFAVDPTAVFNQFIGHSEEPKLIRYQIEVWDDKQALRNFQVSASLKNNIQLTFKGLLNPKAEGFGHFIPLLNEEWEGEELVNY